MPEATEAVVGIAFRDEDWYGDHPGSARFVDCTFTDIDLTQVTTAGSTFEAARSTVAGSTPRSTGFSAFVACDFRRVTFFDAVFDGRVRTGRRSPTARCDRSG